LNVILSEAKDPYDAANSRASSQGFLVAEFILSEAEGLLGMT
jgi:hypothetical protein